MSDTPQSKEQTFIDHLIELRNRLVRVVLGIAVVLACLLPFSQNIYQLAAQPLQAMLPAGATMIATGVITPFLVPIKLVLLLSVVISLPYSLYQIWAFIAPGLYRHEKRLIAPLVFSSVLLFYCGMAFAYFLVFPLVFKYMVMTTPAGVAMMTDISQYLDFILAVFLAFGLAFETPVVTYLLVLTGMVTPDSLANKRRYIIVGAFVIGAILTPPDIISQTLLAVPMWLMFEIGLLLARMTLKKRQSDEYQPLTPEEMDAELDRIEKDEKN
jgi:sec-independent protein translocase protein TatC